LFFIILLSSLRAFSANSNDIFDQWVLKQYQVSFSRLIDNIATPANPYMQGLPLGFVVASPSKVAPNYYFHWVRDAALVMKTIQETLTFEESKSLMLNYTNLVLSHQAVDKLTGLGEPKFNTNGTSYKGPWGRPQNDGPALRAIALIEFAKGLIANGEIDYVRKYLYGSEYPGNGPGEDYTYTAIKKDLEYVTHNWNKPDFDLWEEVQGAHFFTRYVQRASLIKGAALANGLGDYAAAKWYLQVAQKVGNSLERHWSEKQGFVLSTLDRVQGVNKSINLDSSVILAANHASISGLSFEIDDPKIIKTADKIIETFKQLYSINVGDQVGIGRYPEDVYDGNGFKGGNPWFLLTSAMAEYFYKLSNHLLNNPQVTLNSQKLSALQILLKSRSNNSLELAQILRNRANSFLEKIRIHSDQNTGSLSEQFDRNHGYMRGAVDLTWSYAAFLSSVNAMGSM
jgi:glucoamylase